MNAVAGSAPASRQTRSGLFLGMIAIVFWSFGASLVYLGAQESGTWPFVALASVTAGGLLMIARRVLHGEVRSALRLPWRLWLIPLSCFVVYGVVWPWALASSSSRQVFGVSLINYLWPVLTVLFSVWLVPGVRLTGRVILAVLLALSGLAAANFHQLQQLHIFQAGAKRGDGFLPYALALVAAVTWGLYSAFLARWRDWAKNYVTSPIGFLLIGIIGCGITASTRRTFPHFSSFGALTTVLYGAGPLAVGYLCWEIALARGKVQTLSLLAAGTPVLSTAFLCVFLRKMPGTELILAAALVSAGVALSVVPD